MNKPIQTLIMLGKPGAGKGTQSGILKERLRFSIVGYGDFFRGISKEDTFVSRKVKETIDTGSLLPHWFPSYVLMDKLFHTIEAEESIILDGACRSRKEAELAHEVLNWFERPYKAVYIDISDQEAIDRLTSRRELINRADDDAEHIKTRLEAYHNTVIPAIEFFREQGMLIEINGAQGMEEVSREILTKLAEAGLETR